MQYERIQILHCQISNTNLSICYWLRRNSSCIGWILRQVNVIPSRWWYYHTIKLINYQDKDISHTLLNINITPGCQCNDISNISHWIHSNFQICRQWCITKHIISHFIGLSWVYIIHCSNFRHVGVNVVNTKYEIEYLQDQIKFFKFVNE